MPRYVERKTTMKTLTLDGVAITPTHGAHRKAGFQTVDTFRAWMKNHPDNAPKPIQIGRGNFFTDADLEAIKAARKAK